MQSANAAADFKGLDADLSAAIGVVGLKDIKDTHVVLDVPADKLDAARAAVTTLQAPGVKVMSAGETIEIFKEVGLPKDVAARFGVSKMSARMASAIPGWQPNLRLPPWAPTRSRPAWTSAPCA